MPNVLKKVKLNISVKTVFVRLYLFRMCSIGETPGTGIKFRSLVQQNFLNARGSRIV